MLTLRVSERNIEKYHTFLNTRQPVLLTVKQAGSFKKVLLSHGKKQPYRLPNELWEQADVIVCCHPDMLHSEQRTKHIYPNHIGKLGGRWIIKLGLWFIYPI